MDVSEEERVTIAPAVCRRWRNSFGSQDGSSSLAIGSNGYAIVPWAGSIISSAEHRFME